MGFLDKVKGFATSHKKEIKSGIEKAEAVARKKAPAKYDAKISKAADSAQKAVEKLPNADQRPAAGPADPPPVS